MRWTRKRPGAPPKYDQDLIRYLIYNNFRDKNIAAEIGCSIQTVEQIRYRMGIKRRYTSKRMMIAEDVIL